MKKIFIPLFLCMISAAFSLESASVRLFAPVTPRMSAMGNGLTASAKDLEALYINPAALAFNKGTFTVSSIIPAVYSEPEYTVELINSLMTQPNPLSGVLLASKKMITSSGAGLSLTWGLGWTGGNWGLGLVSYVSGFFQGDPFPLGVDGTLNVIFALPAGGAVPIYLGDFCKLSLGADIRPMILYQVKVDGAVADAIAGNPDYGTQMIFDALRVPYFSLAVDLGVQAVFWEQLGAAAVLRNAGTDFAAPGTGRPPIANTSVLNAGIAWFPEYRLFFLKLCPILCVDISDIIGLAEGRISFWKSLHAGAELGLNDILFLRAGLNQGYLTLGASLEVFFLKLGISFYTVEMGHYLGDNPLSAVTVELAIKI